MKHRVIPALDGVRGIALLAVLLCHSADRINTQSETARGLKTTFALGWVGVDLFFVLSGFLITGILLRTREAPNYFQSFYVRRMLRIFPVYYLTLIGALLIFPHSAYLASWLPPGWWQRASYFVYLQNFTEFLTPGWKGPNLLGPFWSLAVEEQFYLLWPVAVLTLSRRGLLMACVALLAVAAPLRALLIQHWGMPEGFILWTTTRCDGLLAGAALAAIPIRVPLRVVSVAAAVSLGALAWIFRMHPAAMTDPAGDVYICTFGMTALAVLFGCLIERARQPVSIVPRVLCFAPLRSVGKYSYGMYVYHFIIFIVFPMQVMKVFAVEDSPFDSTALALAYIAVSIGVVYLVAKLSYDLFESRVLALKSRFSGTPARSRS